MKTEHSLSRLFALTFLFAAAAFSQEITGRSGEYKTTVTKTFNVEPGGKLVMKGTSGDVEVSSWKSNSVEIIEDLVMDVFTRGEAEEILERTESSYSQEGSTIYVRAKDGRDEVHRNYHVRVPEKFNLDVSTSGGDMIVEGVTGTIELNTSGGDIEMTKMAGQCRVRTSGGDLIFKDISGALEAHTSGGDVDLTDIFAETNVQTSGGDITLMNCKNTVSLQTSGGDIDIRQVAGNLAAATSGGDITVSGCQGQTSLSTSGGDIQMSKIGGQIAASTSGGDIDGSDFGDAINVRTSGGEISLTNVRGAATAFTSGGDIALEITLTDFTKPHAIQLETTGGSIELTLPAKFPANITAEIRLDRRDSILKRYDIYSDFPLTKAEPSETEGRILRSTGEINGGGDAVILKTRGGDIRIKKGL